VVLSGFLIILNLLQCNISVSGLPFLLVSTHFLGRTGSTNPPSPQNSRCLIPQVHHRVPVPYYAAHLLTPVEHKSLVTPRPPRNRARPKVLSPAVGSSIMLCFFVIISPGKHPRVWPIIEDLTTKETSPPPGNIIIIVKNQSKSSSSNLSKVQKS